MNENRLEFLKEEMDLKSKDIANMLIIAESTYSEWEHNKIPIPTKRLIELANFYKINIDYILKLTNIRLRITKMPYEPHCPNIIFRHLLWVK